MIRTAAMLFSPSNAAVTFKNLTLWARVSLNSSARKTVGTLFDSEYYLRQYSDVKRSGIQPYLHFLVRGFLEGRNPSERLDTAHYLATYDDVRAARMNPVLHYALFGKAENRSAIPARAQVVDVCPEGVMAMVRVNNDWPAGRPLVSVVVPCFNYGAFVEDAVQSLLAQTFRNFEVILVEGGSTDGVTPQVVRRIEAQRHERVRVFYRRERHLVGDNRNFGIQQARGRYICCLDADDLLRPIYLEIAVYLAEAYGYDVVSPSLQSFGDSDLKWVLEDASFPAICEANQVATTALFRKSAWAHIGGYRDWGLGEDYISEDWDFWVRMLAHGFRAKSIRDLLMDYRVHRRGLTGTSVMSFERQKEVIRKTNAALLAEPLVAPRNMVVEIANRWANLIAPSDTNTPGILIALPFVSIGGAEQLFHTICQGLATRGFRVVIITSVTLPPTVKDVPDRYGTITPHVYHLPKLLDPEYHEDFVIYLLRQYNIQSILVAGSELLYRCLPDIRGRFPDIRIVDQQFNDTGHIERNRRHAKIIDQTLVPSTALADVLIQKFGEQPSRVAVIPHGIDTRGPVWERESAWRASGLPDESRGKLLISWFGRMSVEKSPEVFVEIAARLSHRRDLYFVMTGEGPEWSAVQRLAANHELGNRLHLPGFVDDVRPLMELADIVVLTSRLDGMPLVVLEAQSLGKPVVASAVGSLPEMMIEGETGFLCSPGDVAAFCSALEKLADSEPLRRAFGDRARTFVENRFGAEAMIEAYVHALKR